MHSGKSFGKLLRSLTLYEQSFRGSGMGLVVDKAVMGETKMRGGGGLFLVFRKG